MSALLSADLIPTPLLRPGERVPVHMSPAASVHLRGSRSIVRLLGALFGFAALAAIGRLDAARAGRWLRRVIQQNGFFWIKLGQLISLRSDVFPAAFCNELSHLQDRVHGFSGALAKRAIARELGRSPDEIFERFDERPMAAASVAQVHRARLREGGVEVVVKVMRPMAPAIFARDLVLISRMLRFVSCFWFAAPFRLDEAIWELEQIAREEVDFRYELSNLQRLRKNLRRDGVYVPKAFPAFSTREVLVMEHIDGVLMSDFIRLKHEAPERTRRWLEENHVRPEYVVETLLMSFLHQLITDNLFHGDLHPGNVFLLRDSAVALVDLGSVGTSDRSLIQRYALCLKALAEQDYDKAVTILLSLASGLPLLHYAPIQEDMARVIRAWATRTRVKTLPFNERMLSSLYVDLARVMADNGIASSWALTRIDRSIVTLEATIGALETDVDYLALFDRYFRERIEDVLWHPLETIKDVFGTALDVVNEYRFFVSPFLRRISRDTSGTVARAGAIAASIFRFGALLCAGGLAFTVFAFHHQHRRPLLAGALTSYLKLAPWLEQESWYLLGAVEVLLCLHLLRLGRIARTRTIATWQGMLDVGPDRRRRKRRGYD